MLRSLLVLGALAGAAHAETRTYDVKAVRVIESQIRLPSCGAAGRMLRDRHVIKIDDDTGHVTIDRLRWSVSNPEPDLAIDFHLFIDGVGQKTFLLMDLYVNQRGLSGRYSLYGRTLDDKACSDSVLIDGTRR